MEIENTTLQSNSFVRCIVEASLSQRFKNILSCHGLEASINAFVIVFETIFFFWKYFQIGNSITASVRLKEEKFQMKCLFQLPARKSEIKLISQLNFDGIKMLLEKYQLV